jgi:putative transposase
MRQAAIIVLTPEERAKLDQIVNNPKTPIKIAERVKMIILAAKGRNNESIAKLLKCSAARVGKWRARFAQKRLSGVVYEAPRCGRPAKVREGMTRAIIEKTLTEPPPDQRKYWSSRTMAEAVGVSHTSVHRIWRANSVSPKDRPLPPTVDRPKRVRP